MGGIIYSDVRVKYDFQDEGHTGKIHNVESEDKNHYGMFVFDTYNRFSKMIAFKLVLNIKSFESDLDGGVPVFDVMPGWFLNSSMIPHSDFFDDSSLERCGWVPASVPDGSSGVMKEVKTTIFSGFGNILTLDFVFNCTDRFIGFLISPHAVQDGKYFVLDFYRSTDSESKKPVLKVQDSVVTISFVDKTDGRDSTNRLAPKVIGKTDPGYGRERVDNNVLFRKLDDGYSHDRSDGLKIRGTDPAVNYSMQIKNIALSDKGKITEIYGFNGYTDRYYYPDYIKAVFEKASVKKLNVVTWSGLLVEFPWASLLWYGEIFYFADLEEFGECCRLFFKEHGDDLCPICGNPLGGHFKYSYIDVTKIPHQIYFCSKECLKLFNSSMVQYLYMFRLKDNMEYITEIQL